MSKPIVYIAHPLSGDIETNRAAASKWVAWASLQGCAPIATWIVLSGEWTEEEGRALGLEVDCALIERCDFLTLCGMALTSGMRIERDKALAMGIPVINLIGLSFDEAVIVLNSHIRPAREIPAPLPGRPPEIYPGTYWEPRAQPLSGYEEWICMFGPLEVKLFQNVDQDDEHFGAWGAEIGEIPIEALTDDALAERDDRDSVINACRRLLGEIGDKLTEARQEVAF